MNARKDDRDRADWGADPELLDVLRGADPGRSLPPLSQVDLDQLIEATYRSAAVPAKTSRARILAPVGLAAAAAVLAGVVGVSRLGPFDDAAPRADAPSAAPAPAGPTVLTVPAAVTGRCAVPSADMLAGQQVAFEGTVTSVQDGAATLDPTTVFAGDVSDQVVVKAPNAQMGELLSAVQFEPGRSYLVSATDGRLTLCGYSAPAGPDLRTLYEQAFGG